jgi:translation initiation factor IF-2
LAVRIYALAKELKLDSKELVDICTKAGFPGKGSALASLTEEEAEKVKQFIKGGSTKGKPSAAAPPMPQRPVEPVRTAKMPVIVTPKPAPPRSKASSPDGGTAPVEERPAAALSEVAAATTASEMAGGSRPPGPLAAAVRRDEYIGPGGVRGKIPAVGIEGKQSPRRKSDGGTTERTRPAITGADAHPR